MGTLVCTTPKSPPYVARPDLAVAYRYTAGGARITWEMLRGVHSEAGAYLGVEVTAIPEGAAPAGATTRQVSAFFPQTAFQEALFLGLVPGATYRFVVVIVTSLSRSAASPPSNDIKVSGPPSTPQAPIPPRTPQATPPPADSISPPRETSNSTGTEALDIVRRRDNSVDVYDGDYVIHIPPGAAVRMRIK